MEIEKKVATRNQASSINEILIFKTDLQFQRRGPGSHGRFSGSKQILFLIATQSLLQIAKKKPFSIQLQDQIMQPISTNLTGNTESEKMLKEKGQERDFSNPRPKQTKSREREKQNLDKEMKMEADDFLSLVRFIIESHPETYKIINFSRFQVTDYKNIKNNDDEIPPETYYSPIQAQLQSPRFYPYYYFSVSMHAYFSISWEKIKIRFSFFENVAIAHSHFYRFI